MRYDRKTHFLFEIVVLDGFLPSRAGLQVVFTGYWMTSEDENRFLRDQREDWWED